MSELVGVKFEVFGRVQRVFFRNHTQQRAQELGLVGWCMNTPQGTVQGVVEGNRTNIDLMKVWLQTVGSPQSKIDRCDFTEYKVAQFSFQSFDVKRKKDVQ